MSVVRLHLLIVFLCVVVAPHTDAATYNFGFFLTPDQVIPAVPNQGTSAYALGVYTDAGATPTLAVDMEFYGLDLDGLQTPNEPNDDVIGLHIRRGAPGTNGPIVFGIIDADPALRNDLDDRAINPTIDRIHSKWDTAFFAVDVFAHEGNGTTLAAEAANVLAGNMYFSVATKDHPDGEIRGQIIFNNIPEPGTMGLVAGLALLRFGRRRAAR